MSGAWAWRRVGTRERVSNSSVRTKDHAEKLLRLWTVQGKAVGDVEVVELRAEDWGAEPGTPIGA